MKKIKKALPIAISLIALGFAGCGGGGSSTAENNPNVEYGGDIDGDNDIAKYMNADWLFQNYFGEYGLPEELKELMMPELKMMANGFALQYAKGEDVETSMSELNTAMMALYYSGQLGESMQMMQEEYSNNIYTNTEQNLSENSDMNFTREITEEEQVNINEAEKLDEEYKKEQEELVKEYNLPYPLPNKVNKTFTYTSQMKSSGGKNGGTSTKTKFKDIDDWNWWDADFFWTDASTAGVVHGHVGFVDERGRSAKDTAIDSMPDDGVQSHYGLTNYFNLSKNDSWERVEAWYFIGWDKNRWQRKSIIDWAYNRVGNTSYSLLTGKNNQNETYCSSFVWQGFKEQGYDLDYDKGVSVWPNDLRNHKYTKRFNSQNR